MKILMILIFLLQISGVQGLQRAHLSKELQKSIDKLRIEQKIPGMAITTFTSRGKQFSLSSGYLNLKKTQQFDSSSTLVPVSSVSKIFTTLGTFQLIERGLFDLDTPLTFFKRTPFYKVIKKKCPNIMKSIRKINVGHLLSHQGGMNQDLPGANLWWDAKALEDGRYPSWQTFRKHFCQTEFLFEPGPIKTGMKYSNLGFNLLAQIIASFDKSNNFENYIKRNILGPLRMDNTFYKIDRNTARNHLSRSHGNPGGLRKNSKSAYNKDKRTIFPRVLNPASYAGSIGISISSEDLARLGHELLSWTGRGQSRLKSLLRKRKDILKPMSPYDKSLAWSHGLMLFNTRSKDFSAHQKGYICYGHTGTNYGSRAVVYACPELDWGFAAVLNSRDANHGLFMRGISQILIKKGIVKRVNLGRSTRAWIKSVHRFHQSTILKAPVRPDEIDSSKAPVHLKPYIGSYHTDTTGVEKVGISANGKLIFLGYELLREKGRDRFRFPPEAKTYFSSEPVRFIRKSGRVIGIHAAQVLYADKIN